MQDVRIKKYGLNINSFSKDNNRKEAVRDQYSSSLNHKTHTVQKIEEQLKNKQWRGRVPTPGEK